MKSPYVEDIREDANLRVERRDGTFTKITELLEPFGGILVSGTWDLHSMQDACRQYGTDDAEFVCAMVNQIQTLRRGNVKFSPWQTRFILSYIRTNDPASPALAILLMQAAITHLEIIENQNRMELSYGDIEYDIAARIMARLMKLSMQQTATYETLAGRRLKQVAIQQGQPQQPQSEATANAADPQGAVLETADGGAAVTNLKVVK